MKFPLSTKNQPLYHEFELMLYAHNRAYMGVVVRINSMPPRFRYLFENIRAASYTDYTVKAQFTSYMNGRYLFRTRYGDDFTVVDENFKK